MADIIVDNLSVEADLEASIEAAMIDAEMDTDSNIELALEVTTWGGGGARANLDNYLAKDNEIPYEPVGDYNPATKLYVDDHSITPRTGESLSTETEALSGVVFCTEGYGDDFLEGAMYEYDNGELIKVIELSGVGGNTNQTETITPLETNAAVGKPVILEFEFKSKSSGKGTAKLYINGVLKSSKIVSKEVNSFDVTEYVKEGTNYFTVTVTDSSNSSVTFDYIVNGVKLTLKSSFNEGNVYTGDVTYTYTVIGAGQKTVTFTLDNEEIGSVEIRSSGEQSKYVLTGLTHGAHILKVKATTIVNEVLIESNELVNQILYAEEGVTTPLVSSTFSRTEAIEGELLSIDYLVYDPANVNATVYLQVNDETPTEVKVPRTKQYWSISNYPAGEVIFRISCGDVKVELPVTVTELVMDIEPVQDDLMLYLTATNRSNAELEEARETWSYNDISCTLTNFNWSSNGWINNTLKFTGEAEGYIPLEIFGTDPKAAGRTIEIEFATHNIINYNSILLSCYTEEKGIQITPTEAFLKSEQEEVKVRFKEDEKTRVSFVIESTNDNRLIRTYVNGILSGIAQFDSTDNFQQGAPLGITINEGHEEIDIYTIRIYDIALSSRQVLNNYICDLTDVTEKIAKYQANNVYDLFGSISMAKIKSMIPILTITGELPPVKGEKKTISTTYTDPFNPQMDFTKDNCILDIQGTSSQYYPKKNYKIKFPEAFSFYEGAIPENEYTFKADYMESSHSHNTGNAILVNSLYSEFFPTQTAENGVRNTIYGFPCAIYYRANEAAEYEYFGAYNFNNDKGNAATLGLTGEKAQSWEFKNNTSTHCLLRNDDFSPEAKPEDDFEARYPDKYTDYTDLQRVVSWIVSTDGDLEKFKNEFNQHFNLHYCLIYYVMLEWGLMMDSRAKNMFFDTIDGNIWYPRMYDMDTCYGLNNEGVLNFGYGLEQHDEDIYNGENSLFWNNFEECYAQEIKDMYLTLRTSGKLSYENMMTIFKQQQIDKICEAQFNEDAQFKYISPIIEDNDTTYAYVAQGNRLSHFQWWISNRIKYLDSKYEAADYLADFITMRMYTNTGSITVTPYIDQYLKIRYGSADVKVRGASGTPTLVPCPAGLTFNDTETIIYGANGISSIGDVSDKYPGTVDVSKGLQLSELKIGSDASGYINTHLTTLTLGNNKLLRSIDVSNCPNLTGNLNVEGCTALREFKAAGSGLKGVTFVNGGDLETLVLPQTITNLTIKNHANLTSVTPSKFDNLQTLILKNTGLNATDILNANYKSLTRLYCIFPQEANIELSIFTLDYLLTNCKGVDDNNLNIDYPNLQGYITLSYPSVIGSTKLEEVKEKYANAFPYLNITYKSVPSYFSYDSANNRINFPVLSANLPAIVTIPDRDQIEDFLGLTEGTINENTGFYANNTTDSTYKNPVTEIILPEGYAYYYISLEHFDNLEKFTFPKGYTKFTYFRLGITSPYAKKLSVYDFSGSNIDMSQCDYLYLIPFGKVSLANLNFGDLYSINGSNSTSQGLLYYIFNTNNTNVYKLTELNTSNIIAEKTPLLAYQIDGYSYYNGAGSSTTFDWIGRNMHLPVATEICYNYAVKRASIDFSESYVPKVTKLNFGGTYYTNYGTYVKLNNITAPNITNLYAMCGSWLYLTNFESQGLDTSKVTNMGYLFYNCQRLEELDLSHWNFDSATNLSYAFYQCYKLDLKLPEMNTSKMQLDYAFCDCNKITNLETVTFDLSTTNSARSLFNRCYVLSDVNFTPTDAPNMTTMYYMFADCRTMENINLSGLIGNAVTTTGYAFSGTSNLKSLNLDNFEGSIVTESLQMFQGCGVENISLPNMTSQLTNMNYMFNNCPNLKEIHIPKLNTSAAANMAYVFSNCPNLENIETGDSFNTSSAIYLNHMFYNSPKIDFSNILNKIDTSNTVSTSYMFCNCPLTQSDLDIIKTWDTSKVTDMSYMFNGCNLPEEVDLSGFRMDSVTSSTAMFANNSNIKSYKLNGVYAPKLGWNLVTGLLTTSIEKLDLTGNETPMSYSYNRNATGSGYVSHEYPNYTKLKELILPSAEWHLGLGVNGTIFRDSPLEILNIGTLDALWYSTYTQYTWPYKNLCQNKTTLREITIGNMTFGNNYANLSYMFNGCTNLTTVNMSTVDTALNSSIAYMFLGCKSIESIDLSWMNTQSVTTMRELFNGCSNLKEVNIEGFNFAQTTSIFGMFAYCGFETLHIKDINNAPVLNDAGYLFRGCDKLTEITFENTTDFDLITSMAYWFEDCASLTSVDLTPLNVPKVTNFTYMFNRCSSLEEVDLSNITVSANVQAQYLFANCLNLKKIDIRNWQINKITTSGYYAEMFTNVPIDCLIIVKDESCRTWIKNRKSTFTNVVLASEITE